MNESRFRCLMESSVLALGCWRADGSFFDGNDALLGLLGCGRQELEAGRVRWSEITPPEYAPLDAQALHEIRARGECIPFEKEYIRSDGQRVPILIGATAFGDGVTDSGTFFAVDLSTRNRTNRTPLQSAVGQVFGLTERQRLVCLLASQGLTHRRIARLLDVGIRTIELERNRAAKMLRLPTSAVSLWAVENRETLTMSVRGSRLLTAAVAGFIHRDGN